MKPALLCLLLAAVATVFATVPAGANDYEIVDDASVFAVLTHKAGLAARLAHNHLIVADAYEARLELNEGEVENLTFEIDLAIADLIVDNADRQSTWYPRLAELGLLDEPFADISDGDRGKIRKAMLGKGQLAAETFPRIKATASGLSEAAATLADVAFSHQIELSFEVHGEMVKKNVPMRWEETDDGLVFEAVGSFKFSDFGIEPYSAMLGAVKNQDDFHVYVSLTARRGGGES